MILIYMEPRLPESLEIRSEFILYCPKYKVQVYDATIGSLLIIA
jgi:hypothetical protein